MNAELWFPGKLIFIDETSKDGRALRRSHDRAHEGSRIVQRETILPGRRFSILGVLSIDGFVDWHMVERGYSAEGFLYAFEHHVLLRPHTSTHTQFITLLLYVALLVAGVCSVSIIAWVVSHCQILDNCPKH
jgi:hypothetical protein